MRKFYLLLYQYSFLFILLFLTYLALGQQNQGLNPAVHSKFTIHPVTPSCASDALLNEQRRKPGFKSQEENLNQKILSVSGILGAESYILPVVFHIITPNPESITDAQVIAALNNLNDAFGKKGIYAASNGADTKIQFCLAMTDPDGGSSTGITRTVSTFIGSNLNAFIEDDKLKNLNRWDPSRYINIWIITSTNFEGVTNFVCGNWLRLSESAYATFPGTGQLTDGIVLSGISPGPGQAHEMGHYLGLYHTFEGLDCSNNDCLTNGDHVCDTPPDASVGNSPSCTSPQNSCTTDTFSNHSNGSFPVDVPDQIANFMDYSNNACHNEFTEGQAERMRAAIATQRSGLLKNECDKPCAENSVAYFTRDIAQPLPGNIVQFTNTSTGATQFEWLVNGVSVSTNANYSTSFAANGVYKVMLKAYNSDATCFASYSDFVMVTCGVTASFYADKKTIASKFPIYLDKILFTNNSTNAVGYRWLLSFNGAPEQLVSTDLNETYVFPNPGNYSMRLIATNGGCSDTTEYYSIPVADPTQDGTLYFNDVECYQETKIRVAVQFCNSGYATIPANMPVTFYDSDPRNGTAKKIGTTFFFPQAVPGNCCSNSFPFILDVNAPGLNQLWAALNDSGTSNPFSLPGTSLQEVSYLNNFSQAVGFQFHITAIPPSTVLQAGDTLQLGELINPVNSGISSFVWSTTQDLNCTICPAPYFVAGNTVDTLTKELIATSLYGCRDTSYLEIKIPPYNDYSISLDRIECARNDSLLVDFTLCNHFKRGIIPLGVPVSFYDADPSSPDAHILGPVFTTPADVPAKCASYTFLIKGISAGSLYAVVNNNGKQVPLVFPDDTLNLEKDYSNNISLFAYQPDTVSLQPSDTTIFRKQTIPVLIKSTVFDPSSTTWLPGNGYTLSCTACASPLVTVTDNSMVTMQTANQYGCFLKGKMKINIFPPDMVVQLVQSNCFTNNTTRVKFIICMNNGYDSIFENLPVSFYDEDPSTGKAHLLQKTFYTSSSVPLPCDTFILVVSTPLSGHLYAVVNDKGDNSSIIPDKAFDETDYTNNAGNMAISPFVATIYPADTTIFRNTSVQIMASVTGGQLSNYLWDPGEFLSCTNCLTPVVTLPYSMKYAFVAQNEFGCVDTVYANLKTFAGGNVDIPNAFTPNGDGRNDIFYILGSRDITSVKDFVIYNRQGEKMFEVSDVPGNDPRYGWNGLFNGKRAAAEAYVYFAKIQFTNGTEQLFKGTVVLIR